MKSTLTISLEKDLKEAFVSFAKSLWTNPTNLLNMMMKNSIVTRELNFVSPTNIDIEIEPFCNEEIKSLNNNKNIRRDYKKLEKLLA